MKKHAIGSMQGDSSNSEKVKLKWSEVLESAFDYYYCEYIPAWALSKTPFNNISDKVFICKKTKEWISWEKVDSSKRPDIATLFDLLPDLPQDDEYWQILRELESKGIKDAESYFWENVFSYKQANEVEIKGKKYKIEWEA